MFDQDELKFIPSHYKYDKLEFTSKDLISKNLLFTLSVVFRNNFSLKNDFSWYDNIPIGDWPLFLIALQDKKIKILDEEMGFYRMHNESVFGKIAHSEKLKKMILTRKRVLFNLNLQTTSFIKLSKIINDYEYELFKSIKKRSFLSKRKFQIQLIFSSLEYLISSYFGTITKKEIKVLTKQQV
jgi:hypothetical protein